MIRRILSLIGMGTVAYVVVFIPMGDLTLWQHFVRIWSTDEAQEMTREVEGAIRELEEDLEDRLHADAGVLDAGDAGEASEDE